MAKVAAKQLAPGSEGQVLKTVSGVPTWAAESAGGGVQAVGSPSITKMEPISLTGPATYSTASPIVATFPNLTTVERAVICAQISGSTRFHFVIVSKSGNTVTIRAFKSLPGHTHTFTGSSHTHSLTMNSHTHSLTMNAHNHSLTMNAHGHSLTSIAGSGGLALSITPAPSGLVHPTGNATRTIAAGSTSGVGNTTDTGTVGNATSTGTVGGTVSTGTVGSTVAAGSNATTTADALEEATVGTPMNHITLELLGFGT